MKKLHHFWGPTSLLIVVSPPFEVRYIWFADLNWKNTVDPPRNAKLEFGLFLRGNSRIAAAMPSERPASALSSGGLLFVLGYLHVNGPVGPAGRVAQKATQVILLCRHGGEKQTSSNRRDRLYCWGTRGTAKVQQRHSDGTPAVLRRNSGDTPTDLRRYSDGTKAVLRRNWGELIGD